MARVKINTLEEAVREYIEYNPCNPCYRDSWYLEKICEQFGHDAVVEEIKRQEAKQI